MHFNNCTEKGNLCNPLFELNYKQWLQDEDVHREHSWTTTIKPLFHSYMRRFVSCFPTFMFSFGIAASMVVYSAGNKTCNKVIIKKFWWKTGWLRISIMCSGGATCLPMDCCLTIKKSTKRVGLVHRWHHLIECNFLSQWFINVAEKLLTWR